MTSPRVVCLPGPAAPKALVHALTRLPAVVAFEARFDAELTIANYDSMAAAERLEMVGRFSAPHANGQLLLLSAGAVRADYPELFGKHVLKNLLGLEGDREPRDLAVTVRKLLGERLTGLQPYLGADYQRRMFAVTTSKAREQLLAEAAAFAVAHGATRRFAQICSETLDEMLTNALYDAPADLSGRARFGDRNSPVELLPAEAIEVEFGANATRLGVRVKDPFGTLRAARVLDYLAKCFRRGENQVDEKVGGAGLGLYYSFERFSHFALNLTPGVSTEVLGLIDLGSSFRQHQSRPKSFNLFVGA